MRSIRQFLVINLLIGVLFATNLAILSNLYFGYKSIRPHLDAQMVVMAYSLDAFLQDDIRIVSTGTKVDDKVQHYTTSIQAFPYDDQSYLEDLHRSIDNIQFVVHNAKGQMIVRSANAPKTSAEIPSGFSSVRIHNEKWRTFKLTTSGQKTITIFHPHHARLYIEEHANTKAIIIILLTIPPLGLFLWIIISRSLVSIRETTNEIKQRAHNNLNPIPTQNIPLEIQPLILEINSLFDRLHSNFIRESRFAADAAHELKTPLAALKTHVQVAQSLAETSDIRPYLEKIITSVNRASHTIDQLLMLSRTMPDVYMREHELVNLNTAVTMTLAELTPAALKKDITLSLTNQLKKNAVVFGHEVALQTLMSNLVDNAIRYSYPHTSIHVLLSQVKNDYVISVTDQGPGIPEELRARVFERFYRIIGSQQTGTGLGLNIVHQIIGLHQGSIKLQTPPSGIGLCVRVCLPCPPAEHTRSE